MGSMVKKFDLETLPLAKLQSYLKSPLYILTNTFSSLHQRLILFGMNLLYSRKVNHILQAAIGLNSRFFLKFRDHLYTVVLADFHRSQIATSIQVHAFIAKYF